MMDRFGEGGCYTCRICGKKTRDTGNDEASLMMCRFCADCCNAENTVNDGHEKLSYYSEEIQKVLKGWGVKDQEWNQH